MTQSRNKNDVQTAPASKASGSGNAPAVKKNKDGVTSLSVSTSIARRLKSFVRKRAAQLDRDVTVKEVVDAALEEHMDKHV